MATKITGLPYTRPIVDSRGILTQEARSFFRVIIDRSLIIGTGSPEGVIEAEQGAEYMDDTGTAGNIKYIKRDSSVSGDRSKGWILV